MFVTAVLLAAILGASTWMLLRRFLGSGPKLDIPYLQFDDDDNSDSKYMTQSRSIISRGYREYLKHDKPFCMRNPTDRHRPIAILPFKYLEEVRRAPENRLSLPLHLEKNSILNHIGGPQMSDEVIQAAKLSLNRALDRLTETVQEECIASFQQTLPSPKDWTPIHLYPLILQAFSRMSARVLVGPEFRDEWQKLSLPYISTVLKAPGTVRAKYHPSLFWLAKYFEADVKDVYKYRKQASKLLEPTINSRINAARSASSSSHQTRGNEKVDKPEDAIQWLLDAHLARGRIPSADDIAQNLFVLMTASIHSTSATALSILFDLMDYPGPLDLIKREISRVRQDESSDRQTKDSHGVDTTTPPPWTRQMLGRLVFLDSFMRESMRVHSFTQLTVQRLVTSKPYTFKDGLTLPVGTTISFASNEYNLDSDLVHGASDASVLDSTRHILPGPMNPQLIEEQPDHKAKLKVHFASTENTIVWGSGTHACPGRFLAQDAIKIMLVFLLTRYQFKFPPKEEPENASTTTTTARRGEDGKQRPADMPMNFNIVPNVMAPVLIKINEGSG